MQLSQPNSLVFVGTFGVVEGFAFVCLPGRFGFFIEKSTPDLYSQMGLPITFTSMRRNYS